MTTRVISSGMMLVLFVVCGACSREPDRTVSVRPDTIPVYPLYNRLENFSTAPDLILVRIANSSGNTATVVMENDDWYWGLARQLGTPLDGSRYLSFMLSNQTQAFTLDNTTYTNLLAEYGAELLPEHQRFLAGSRQAILDAFMQKEQRGSGGLCYIADLGGGREMQERSLARLFIEEGIQVYRGCIDGSWHAVVVVDQPSTQKE